MSTEHVPHVTVIKKRGEHYETQSSTRLGTRLQTSCLDYEEMGIRQTTAPADAVGSESVL